MGQAWCEGLCSFFEGDYVSLSGRVSMSTVSRGEGRVREGRDLPKTTQLVSVHSPVSMPQLKSRVVFLGSRIQKWWRSIKDRVTQA
jgi:hypothetical protein